MKLDKLYPSYMAYLEMRLEKNIINKGKYSLLKISRQSFDEFKNRYENDETFSDMIVELMKTEIRDKKIDNIFDDFD